MIIPKIGTKFFRVSEKNNIFRRQRITMVDDNGIEWHRYNVPIKDYEIIEIEITGKATKTIEGHAPSYEEDEISWFARYGNKEIDDYSPFGFNDFNTYEEAEKFKNNKIAKDKELD